MGSEMYIRDRVRHIGNGVAAVAAVDEDTAVAALEAFRVEYEELHPYFDPQEALEASDGPFIHEPKKEGHYGNLSLIHI